VGLAEYLTVIRWRWRLFAAFVATVVGGVVILAVLMPEKYIATATVYFVTEPAESDSDLTEIWLYPQTVVHSYAEAAVQPLVLNRVIQQLHLPISAARLADSVKAISPLGTVIIKIKATDVSPVRAAEIANAVATQLVRAADAGTAGATLADSSIRVFTIASAKIPKYPSEPRKSLMVLMAGGWSVLAGAAGCIWLARIDPRVRSRADLAGATPAHLLGYLPRQRDGAGQAQWDELQANFAVLRDSGAKSLLFVSAATVGTPSRVVSQLAESLLATGSRVLVIEADLRRRKVPDHRGLSSVLRGECGLAEAIIQVPDHPPTLPCGPVLTDPAGALASPEMAALLRVAEAAYDVVLIRSAPLLATTEALALSPAVDGVVLVGDRKAMRRDLFRRALSAVERAGGTLRAVVLCA
jgi:capsular polysaccharide biosynthesis protein